MWLAPSAIFERSRSAADTAALTWGSGSRSEGEPELWLSLSGTLEPRPRSWNGWKNRPWIRRLSSAICSPSTVDDWLDRSTSSLRASPVRTIQPPATEQERTASETSGRKSCESPTRAKLRSCSSRTSAASSQASGALPYRVWTASGWDGPTASLFGAGSLPGFWETWPSAGSMRSGACYQRETLEPRTGESVGGSSRRTGNAFDSGDLQAAAQSWATPTAGDSKASGSRTTEDSKAHPGTSLIDQIHGSSSGRPAPASAKPGPESRPRLNPRFVEGLMGLPPGWTTATASECSGTESSRSRPPSRSGGSPAVWASMGWAEWSDAAEAELDRLDAALGKFPEKA